MAKLLPTTSFIHGDTPYSVLCNPMNLLHLANQIKKCYAGLELNLFDRHVRSKEYPSIKLDWTQQGLSGLRGSRQIETRLCSAGSTPPTTKPITHFAYPFSCTVVNHQES